MIFFPIKKMENNQINEQANQPELSNELSLEEKKLHDMRLFFDSVTINPAILPYHVPHDPWIINEVDLVPGRRPPRQIPLRLLRKGRALLAAQAAAQTAQADQPAQPAQVAKNQTQ
jgi:hypothetical protein